MFGLLKRKPSSYLGIDIGTNSIKLVELENIDGRPRLVTYGIVELESGISRSIDSESDKNEKQSISFAIRDLLVKTGAYSRIAVSALPNFSVFSSVISLPNIINEKKIDQAVQWEAKKFVPMPIENVILDWKIIPHEQNSSNLKEDKESALEDPDKNSDKNSKVLSILLTAAPRHLVERYIYIFKAAGIKLISLETESFALARSLVGNEQSSILVADIGSFTTDVTIVKQGIPIFSRSINVGGKTITQSIADSMGISMERAEQFKRDTRFAPESSEPNNNAKQGQSGVAQIIERTFAPVVNEIKYTLDIQKSHANHIEKVLITGGSSFLPSIDSYLAKALGLKVFIANPWARISYPRDLAEVLNNLAPRMAVAIGLAMREIE